MITNIDSNKFIVLISKIQELTSLIDQYNSVGYGECRVIETKEYFVFEFYNAGFSENEELDNVIKKMISYRHYRLIHELHPMMIFIINKKIIRDDLNKVQLLNHDNHPIYNPFRETKFYDYKKEYKYEIELS